MFSLRKNSYWNRVWIAQEMLLPSPFKVFVFDGIDKHEIEVLHDYLKVVLEQHQEWGGKEPWSQDYDEFFVVRYFARTLWKAAVQEEEGLKPSLMILLPVFAICGCQDHRIRECKKRKYSLSDIDAEVDYNIKPAEICQNVLGQFLPGAAVDYFLHCGALLVNAPKLQNPSSKPDSKSDGANLKSDDSKALYRVYLFTHM
jgi:hypothetical protein